MTTRAWLLVLALLTGLLGGSPEALAQPRPPAPQVDDVRRVEGPRRADTPEAAKPLDPGRLQNSKPLALVFWLFALMVVGGAIFVLTRRNLVVAVMGMVASFFAIACVYAMLFAHFLAVIQVLVYAGAIMVLFVFVIMILNKPEDQPWSRQAWPGKVLAIAASGYLLFRLVAVLWGAKAVSPEAARPPPQVVIRQVAGDEVPRMAAFGSTRAVGKTLFQDYLFPFEAISLVLLVAVVGALAVARPHHDKQEGTAPEQSA